MAHSVVNVSVRHLRRQPCACCGRTYATFAAWAAHPRHLYVGRRVARVDGTFDSPYRNLLRVNPQQGRQAAVDHFRRYAAQRSAEWRAQLRADLANKSVLGCWCHPEPCHANVLLEIATKDEEEQ